MPMRPPFNPKAFTRSAAAIAKNIEYLNTHHSLDANTLKELNNTYNQLLTIERKLQQEACNSSYLTATNSSPENL
ncbi:MAG: hypothetical protein AAFY72_15840 [Cyanobacteria bacterium J06649_4]